METRILSQGMRSGENDFNIEILKEHKELEEESFWYRGRKELIIWAVAHYFPNATEMLEIGSGTGFILSEIQKSSPSLRLLAGDIYLEGLKYVKTRVRDVSLYQFDIRNIPFNQELNIIGAFDVLEHVQEDQQGLNQMFQAIRYPGGIVLTVPQHPFLWSSMDERCQHKRRYVRKELVRRVEKAGFSVVWVTSFGTLVLPLKLMEIVIRFIKEKLHIKDERIHLVQLPKWINDIIYMFIKIENFLIQHHISFPFGASLLVIAKKLTSDKSSVKNHE